MAAPLYQPSSSYEARAYVQQHMTARDNSCAEFIANPKTSVILFAGVSGFKKMDSSDKLKAATVMSAALNGLLDPLVKFGAATTRQGKAGKVDSAASAVLNMVRRARWQFYVRMAKRGSGRVTSHTNGLPSATTQVCLG